MHVDEVEVGEIELSACPMARTLCPRSRRPSNSIVSGVHSTRRRYSAG